MEKIMDEIIQRILNGEGISSLSETYSVSENTILDWLEWYKNEKFLEVKELIKLREYDKSLEILDLPIFQDDPRFQSLKVKVFLRQEKNEEALEICNRKIFFNNEYLQSQKVTALVHQEKYEEALEICNRDKYQDDEVFQSQKALIFLNYKKDSELYQLALKLYYNNLTLEEIFDSSLDKWTQTIFLFAYFEKIKSFNGVSYMKKWKNCIELSKEEKKIWNRCMERLQNKRTIYLQEFYNLILFGIRNIKYDEDDFETTNSFLSDVSSENDEMHLNLKKSFQ